MAQDIGYDLTTEVNVALAVGSDPATGSASDFSSAIDLGDPTPIGLVLSLIVTGLTSADGFAFLEFAWSKDGTVFPDSGNLITVMSIDCIASADATKVDAIEVKARHFKARLQNETGGVIDVTSSNTNLKVRKIFLNQV